MRYRSIMILVVLETFFYVWRKPSQLAFFFFLWAAVGVGLFLFNVIQYRQFMTVHGQIYTTPKSGRVSEDESIQRQRESFFSKRTSGWRNPVNLAYAVFAAINVVIYLFVE